MGSPAAISLRYRNSKACVEFLLGFWPSCPVVISLPYLVLAAFSSFTLSRSLAGVFSAYRPPNEILCQGLILTEPREDSGLVNLYSFDLRKFVGIVAKQCLTLRVAVLKCKIRKRFRSLIWSEQAKSCFLWLPRPSLTSPPTLLSPSGPQPVRFKSSLPPGSSPATGSSFEFLQVLRSHLPLELSLKLSLCLEHSSSFYLAHSYTSSSSLLKCQFL